MPRPSSGSETPTKVTPRANQQLYPFDRLPTTDTANDQDPLSPLAPPSKRRSAAADTTASPSSSTPRARRATLATEEIVVARDAEDLTGSFDSRKTLGALDGRRKSIASVIAYQPSPSVNKVLQSPVRTPARTPRRGGMLDFLDTSKGKKAERREEKKAEVVIEASTSSETPIEPAFVVTTPAIPAPLGAETTNGSGLLVDDQHTDSAPVLAAAQRVHEGIPGLGGDHVHGWVDDYEEKRDNGDGPEHRCLADAGGLCQGCGELDAGAGACCQELSRYIEEGKTAVQKIEEDVGENNPHFFHEYLDGSADLRDFMEQRFKLIKTHSRLSAKENWYDWRDKLVTDVNEVLKKNLEHLQRDKKYVNQFSQQLEEVMPEVETYHTELKRRYLEAKAREEEIAKCDKEQLQGLEEAIEEQKEQLTIFGKELQGLETHESELTAKVEKMEEEKKEILATIEKANAICEESKCVTQEDLDKARSEYTRVIAMHGWVPVRVSVSLLELVFDNALRVRIDLAKFKVQDPEDAVRVELVDEAKVKMFGVFLAGINTAAPKWQVREILQDIACYWHKVTLLRNELAYLSLKHQLELSASSEAGALTARIAFFSYAACAKVHLELVFTAKDVRAYPGMEGVKSSVEVLYGGVDQRVVEQVVKKELRNGGYEGLRGLCAQVAELIGKKGRS
ncbi:Spc7 kinetochore protein-domain-containing protein [Jimgerdemannia flammicorona]|uniref:Spc7 kinetochore protein-domain-containing protein n=1 Tax=Jimgerdemannia flammicorona TaxID=994334 RepID=A0A433D481_9FUNG|nr:Spc7 kinetochore protein-domain-containing protein [Jimgerdemannia flammicorona]